MELRIDRSELLLLLRSQMLPGFHAVQYLLLPLRGQGVEMLQTLLELLLPVWWQATKCGIALQGTSLLIERLFAITVQPLAGVMALGRRLVWPRHVVSWLLRGRSLIVTRRLIIPLPRRRIIPPRSRFIILRRT